MTTKARLWRNENGYYDVFVNGRLVVRDESYTVASEIVDDVNGIAPAASGELREIVERYKGTYKGTYNG